MRRGGAVRSKTEEELAGVGLQVCLSDTWGQGAVPPERELWGPGWAAQGEHTRPQVQLPRPQRRERAVGLRGAAAPHSQCTSMSSSRLGKMFCSSSGGKKPPTAMGW